MKRYLLFIIFLICGCGGPEKYPLTTAVSPDGQHSVEVSYLGTFGFGSHDILFESGGELITRKTLYNDGKNLSESNVTFSWQENESVIVELHGEEQKDEVFPISFAGAKPSAGESKGGRR